MRLYISSDIPKVLSKYLQLTKKEKKYFNRFYRLAKKMSLEYCPEREGTLVGFAEHARECWANRGVAYRTQTALINFIIDFFTERNGTNPKEYIRKNLSKIMNKSLEVETYREEFRGYHKTIKQFLNSQNIT